MRQASCQPIDTLISTIPKDERDPTVFYFPSCVLVKQCGGCCAHSGTTCTPTDEVEKVVKIKKTKYVNERSKLQNMGDVTMTIKEHNKCKCLCKKTASDCNSLQKFIKSQCRCECTNLNEAGDCAQVKYFNYFSIFILLLFFAYRIPKNYSILIHVHVFAVTQKSVLLDCTLIKRLVLVNR